MSARRNNWLGQGARRGQKRPEFLEFWEFDPKIRRIGPSLRHFSRKLADGGSGQTIL
jgi:hypothetical protein